MTSYNGCGYGKLTCILEPIYHERTSQREIGEINLDPAVRFTVKSIYEFFRSRMPLLEIYIVEVLPGAAGTELVKDQDV